MRNGYIGFKVSELENERIRRKADQAKVNLSVYVRTTALELLLEEKGRERQYEELENNYIDEEELEI